MGNDLFHKRKPHSTQRPPANRQPYEKILIVCEGEKTEPLYFSELLKHYKISTANVKVTGECGSAPKDIVNYAIELYRHERTEPSGQFDKVYCVFDKDTHTTYNEACQKLTQQKPQGVFVAITSVPCFEYWFLLHFCDSTKPYKGVGKRSASDQVLQELKQQWPEYAKAKENTFSARLAELTQAMNRAKKVLEEAKNIQSDNPSTHVHRLVEYLQNLKNRQT